MKLRRLWNSLIRGTGKTRLLLMGVLALSAVSIVLTISAIVAQSILTGIIAITGYLIAGVLIWSFSMREVGNVAPESMESLNETGQNSRGRLNSNEISRTLHDDEENVKPLRDTEKATESAEAPEAGRSPREDVTSMSGGLPDMDVEYGGVTARQKKKMEKRLLKKFEYDERKRRKKEATVDRKLQNEDRKRQKADKRLALMEKKQAQKQAKELKEYQKNQDKEERNRRKRDKRVEKEERRKRRKLVVVKIRKPIRVVKITKKTVVHPIKKKLIVNKIVIRRIIQQTKVPAVEKSRTAPANMPVIKDSSVSSAGMPNLEDGQMNAMGMQLPSGSHSASGARAYRGKQQVEMAASAPGMKESDDKDSAEKIKSDKEQDAIEMIRQLENESKAKEQKEKKALELLTLRNQGYTGELMSEGGYPEKEEMPDKGKSADKANKAKHESSSGGLYGKYNEKVLEKIFYYYKVPADKKAIVIDQSSNHRISQCPAFVWKDRRQFHILLIERQPRKLDFRLDELGKMRFRANVQAFPDKDYIDLKRPGLIHSIFQGLLPTYSKEGINGEFRYKKNLYIISEDIMLTNFSAKVIFDMLPMAFEVRDDYTNSRSFSYFFKEAYKYKILWRDGVVEPVPYKQRIKELLSEMAKSDFVTSEYQNELDRMVMKHLITQEIALFFKEHRMEIRGLMPEDRS